MACKQPIPAIISRKPLSLGGHVRARSLAAALTLGAGVALSAVTAAVSSATAQELEWATSAGGSSDDVGIGYRERPPRQQLRDRLTSLGTATFGGGRSQRDRADAGDNDDVPSRSTVRHGNLLWATSAGGTVFDLTLGLPSRRTRAATAT